MDLGEHVEALRHALLTAASAGTEQMRETARLLAESIEPAIRLAMIDVLSAMAAEVTAAWDGGLVDVRVRGREPEVVVVPPPRSQPAGPPPGSGPPADDDGSMARISLRLPEQLKARAESAAAAEGLSMNAWLVRAVADALRQPWPGPPFGRGPHRFSGFARS